MLRAPLQIAAVVALSAAPALADCPPGQPALALDPPVALGAPARVLAIGSSTTAGWGAAPGEGYPARLDALSPGVTVVAAGRGGEVAAATFTRLRDRLAEGPWTLVIWQVGVNDALRGVAEADLAATLDAGIAAIRDAGAAPLLMDQQAHPGAPDPVRYARFVALVAEAARRNGAPLIARHAAMARWSPAQRAARMAGDDFHMNGRGYACLARLIADALR